MTLHEAPPFAPAPAKAAEPCSAYFGNLCTGFGNHDQTCMVCRWNRWDHPDQTSKVFPQLGGGW